MARDEYSGYVPRLVGLLMTGATENVLTDFLLSCWLSRSWCLFEPVCSCNRGSTEQGN
jgi:hypothetical protein